MPNRNINEEAVRVDLQTDRWITPMEALAEFQRIQAIFLQDYDDYLESSNSATAMYRKLKARHTQYMELIQEYTTSYPHLRASIEALEAGKMESEQRMSETNAILRQTSKDMMFCEESSKWTARSRCVPIR